MFSSAQMATEMEKLSSSLWQCLLIRLEICFVSFNICTFSVLTSLKRSFKLAIERKNQPDLFHPPYFFVSSLYFAVAVYLFSLFVMPVAEFYLKSRRSLTMKILTTKLIGNREYSNRWYYDEGNYLPELGAWNEV